MKNLFVIISLIFLIFFCVSCSDALYSYQFEISNLSDIKILVKIKYEDEGVVENIDVTVDSNIKKIVLEVYRMSIGLPKNEDLEKPEDILNLLEAYSYEENQIGKILYTQNPINNSLWYFLSNSNYYSYKYLLNISNDDFIY